MPISPIPHVPDVVDFRVHNPEPDARALAEDGRKLQKYFWTKQPGTIFAETRMEFGADLPQYLLFSHRLTSESLDWPRFRVQLVYS